MSVWTAAQKAAPRIRSEPRLKVSPVSEPAAVRTTPVIERPMPSQASRPTFSRPVHTPRSMTRTGIQEMSIDPVPALTVRSP